MGKSKAPKPPDPKKTAAAQTATNIGTAITEGKLNQVNQVTPDGTLTYSQSGTYDYVDPLTGRVHKIPLTTATTRLSDAQQAIKNQNDAAELNLATLARNQSGRLDELLSRPLELNNEAVEGRLMELGSKRLTPELARRRQSLEQQMADRGIRLGSAAYDRAMRNQGEQENDAWNQLLLSGRGQAVQELLTERNQPLNEITALLSGAQVNQPGFVNTPSSNVANADYSGLVNANYQGQLDAWKTKQAEKQALMGGLFSLGTALISDRRAKTDIRKVGRTDDGQAVYAFKYKSGGPMHLGLMADEVERHVPDAVTRHPSGFKQVNYERALRKV
ncbi:tail fiber domain-containing protein [Taklimakanibacter lacteus]|uniref:tail fiber domain-containing protein n=1 Tax=Taklimakanibacter lacteus TaxID=2268456 RepID=UPI0034D3AA9B